MKYILAFFVCFVLSIQLFAQDEVDGLPPYWRTKGNINVNTPAVPATYGSTLFGVDDHWMGTINKRSLAFGTGQIEFMRIDTFGRISLGKSIPTNSNYLLSLQGYDNTNRRNGIDISWASGTISSTAYGINITATNQQINGIRYENTGTGLTNSYSGVAAILSGARNTSGYLAYRTNTGKTYGVFGITGLNSSYVAADSVWAGNFKGRLHIGQNDPTTALSNNIDLEVRNTTTGQPSTTLLRQTTSNATANTTLANLNFGDNYTANPQAQIQVIRDAAGSSAADLPTAIKFSTIADGTNTLSERVRIQNDGDVGINNTNPTEKLDVTGNVKFSGALMPNNLPGATGAILRSQGPNLPPKWTLKSMNIDTIYVKESNANLCINSATWGTYPTCTVTIPLTVGQRVLASASAGVMTDDDCNGVSDVSRVVVDGRIAVNGADFNNGAWIRVSLDNAVAYVMFTPLQVNGEYTCTAAGNYTFSFQARRSSGGSGDNAISGGDNTSSLQATMILIVYTP
jgi:hypothetical protein